MNIEADLEKSSDCQAAQRASLVASLCQQSHRTFETSLLMVLTPRHVDSSRQQGHLTLGTSLPSPRQHGCKSLGTSLPSPRLRGEGLGVRGRSSNRSDNSRAFTLMELMVVLVIIAILTGLVGGALRGAQQDTLAAKTRGTIAKIDAVLNEKFDEYLTKALKFREPDTNSILLRGDFPIENRVPMASVNKVLRIDATQKGLLRERVRLAATRDLMRMEMPDCVGDLFASAHVRPGLATPLPNFSPYPFAPPSPTRPLLYPTLLATGYLGPTFATVPVRDRILMQLETPHAYQRIVQKVWQSDQRLAVAGRTSSITGNPERWADTYSNEELLFLIVEDSYVDGSPAIEAFAANEIGDLDDDGLREFLDAWGNPIRWIRWPAGATMVTPLNPDPLIPGGAPASDPFDPTFADVGFDVVNESSPGAFPFAPGNGLRPLVISAGQDGRFGIRFYNVVPPNQPTGPTSPTPGISAPLFSPSTVMLGTTQFQRPGYWASFGMFNWPDPYCPRQSANTYKRGAVLGNTTVDVTRDPIGVDLNLGAFIPNPDLNVSYLQHTQDNVSNLDESGAAP